METTKAQIIDILRTRVGTDSGLKSRVKFMLDDASFIFIDAVTIPNAVTEDNADADCTIRISSDNLMRVLAGQISPTNAFMMGKLKVEGNLAVAMNLNRIFEAPKS